ncbi:hypothetical protein [Novosphingobium sp.]|uniref:hypothetical protein n=1 Tax=Novosphingobium sp. TaxID=1874826 RepID=UPI002635438B|nr:hypothetical protein [Novosphingobium sp.]
MKRLLPLAFLLSAAPLLAQPGPPSDGSAGRPQRAYANPSALIAADIGFARLAREKGQWTAFRETAADTAEMFDGKRVPAKVLLKDRKDPSEPDKWAPHAAWIACDGSVGLTIGGASYPGGGNGEYVTVWERQLKGKVAWKWVLDDGAPLAKALPEADWVQGTVADCPVRRRPEGDPRPQPGSKRERKEQGKDAPMLPLAGPIPASTAPAGADSKTGQSRDGSLAWRSTVLPDGSRHHTAWIWKGGAMTQVFDRVFAGKVS